MISQDNTISTTTSLPQVIQQIQNLDSVISNLDARVAKLAEQLAPVVFTPEQDKELVSPMIDACKIAQELSAMHYRLANIDTRLSSIQCGLQI